MDHCKNCGAEITDSHTFCSECGARISQSTIIPERIVKYRQSGGQRSVSPWNIVMAFFVLLIIVMLGTLGSVLLLDAPSQPDYAAEPVTTIAPSATGPSSTESTTGRSDSLGSENRSLESTMTDRSTARPVVEDLVTKPESELVLSLDQLPPGWSRPIGVNLSENESVFFKLSQYNSGQLASKVYKNDTIEQAQWSYDRRVGRVEILQSTGDVQVGDEAILYFGDRGSVVILFRERNVVGILVYQEDMAVYPENTAIDLARKMLSNFD